MKKLVLILGLLVSITATMLTVSAATADAANYEIVGEAVCLPVSTEPGISHIGTWHVPVVYDNGATGYVSVGDGGLCDVTRGNYPFPVEHEGSIAVGPATVVSSPSADTPTPIPAGSMLQRPAITVSRAR